MGEAGSGTPAPPLAQRNVRFVLVAPRFVKAIVSLAAVGAVLLTFTDNLLAAMSGGVDAALTVIVTGIVAGNDPPALDVTLSVPL